MRKPGRQRVLLPYLRVNMRGDDVNAHKGRPIEGSFEDFKQEIFLGALGRMRRFRYGGSKKLAEYAYMSAYFALRDLQRIAVKIAVAAPKIFNDQFIDERKG